MMLLKIKSICLVFCVVFLMEISAIPEIKFYCNLIGGSDTSSKECTGRLFTFEDNLVSYLNKYFNDRHDYYDSYAKSIKSIVFKNSTISEIPSIVFTKCSSLKSFEMSGVQLSMLKKENFNNADAVTYLNLANNNLTTLGNMVFSSLKSLQTLDLSNNSIESFHDGAFDECSRSLRSVNLSFNKVKQIKMETFISLSTIKYVALFMDFNEIDEIPKQPDVNNKLTFSAISLKNNKISNFDCSSFDVKTLNLNNNQLEEVTLNCSLIEVSIANNKLNKLTIGGTIESIVAFNNSIVEIIVEDNMKIWNLDLAGNKNADHILKPIKEMKLMKNLDLSDISLGPLSIDSFAKMPELQVLKLKNTGISNIDYGTFAQQKQLTTLDIGGNQLKEIDFHMYSPLRRLAYFDISNNNISKLDNADAIKTVLPALLQININQNNWNCSYLAKLEITFNKAGIFVETPTVMNMNSSNVMGIECTKDTYTKIELLPENGEEINLKFNEMVKKMEVSSTNNELLKLDVDVIQSKLFKLQNDNLELKTQLLQSQLSSFNSTSKSVGDDSNVRSIVEEINKATLDKQNLALEKVTHKLNELKLDLKTQQFESDKAAEKYQVLYEKYNQNKIPLENTQAVSQRYSSDENSNHSLKFTFTEILLTVASGLIIIICILKLKQFCKNKHNNNTTQISKACSQNTLNTVYDNSSV